MSGRYELFVNEPQRFIKCFTRVVLSLAAATFLRLALNPLLGPYRPFVTFLLAGIIVAWLCGLWSAIVTLVVGFLISLALFVPSNEPGLLTSPGFITDVVHFFVVGSVAAIISELLHRSRYRLEAKAAELGRSRQWLSTVLTNIADAVFVVDNRGTLTFVNQSAESLASIAGKNVEGSPFDEVVQIYRESDSRAPVSPLQEVLDGKHTFLHRDNKIARFANGQEVPVIISAAPVKDDNGQIVAAVMVLHDVSERKQIEERLRESEQRFRRLAEASTEGVVILSGEVVQEANERLAQIFGYRLSEMIGKSISTFYTPESQAVIRRNISAGFDKPYEATGIKKDGSPIYLELTGKSTFFDGKPGRVSTVRDITQRKVAERAARSAEERLQMITDAVPALISYVGKDGRYMLVNQEYERWFKHSRAEIEGRHMAEVMGESAWEAVKQYTDQALAGNEVHFEGHLDYQDAGPRWVSISYVPDRDEYGVVQGFVVLVSDLTSRWEAEETIQAWRDRYEKVVSASGMIVYDVDAAAEQVFLGGSLTKITGYDVDHLKNSVQKWIELVHPDDREKFVQQIKDSRISGKFDLEYRFKRADGTYINLHDRGFAIFDASGSVSRVLGLVSDVTELKLAEQEMQSLAERLEEAREDERRRLSRLLHDDVGQQLAAISIKLHRLERKLTEVAPEEQSVISGLVVVEELLHQNQRSIRNIAHILHPSVLEHFGLPEAVRRFVESVAQQPNAASLPETRINVEQGFPRLGIDVETMIYRVIQEAVTNALKHANAKSVTVDLATTPDLVIATVSDDGRGFGSDDRHSTGIGLAGMRDRANAFGSALDIVSAPDKGTTITLSVPSRCCEPEVIGDTEQSTEAAAT